MGCLWQPILIGAPGGASFNGQCADTAMYLGTLASFDGME